MVVIVGAIAELEKSLIVERVRAGMRRAKLEGRRIGRASLDIDRAQVVADRLAGMSLTSVAKKYHVSRATVCRLVKESGRLKKPSVPPLFPRLIQAICRLPPNVPIKTNPVHDARGPHRIRMSHHYPSVNRV
jgi:Homeodomain-like domain